MSTIVTADIHLNENDRDEYRWGLFEWLLKQKADELIINGDLTDSKDRHSAKLVNRFYSVVMWLEEHFKVIINKGNHDYYDADHPFFEFVGASSDIAFINAPRQIKLSIGSALFVPAGTKWDFEIPKVDYLFTHATFSGAKAENGTTMTGVDPAVLDGFKGKVYSGDIHVPQKLQGGLIEYVGAPYHVRFGDSFEPRALWIGNDGRTKDLHFPAPRKHTFVIAEPNHLRDENATKGDHVKVRCLLRRAEYDKWRSYKEEIRQIAEERGWLLFGTEPATLPEKPREEDQQPGSDTQTLDAGLLVESYAKQHGASKDYVEAGLSLLEDNR